MTKKLLVVLHENTKPEDIDDVQQALADVLGVEVVFLNGVKQAILIDTDE